MALRLVFMGTPAFSAATLEALVAAGHEIAAVYTQPPRPAGRRGLEQVPSAVQQTAERLGLEVRSPLSLKGVDEQKAFSDLKSDAAVVVAYGLLLPKPILDGTRLGCFNGHASLLPRWRGAAPIQRAIMAGDSQTGMTVMKMDEGLDTGPICLEQPVAILPGMTSGDLHDRLMDVGAQLMVEGLEQLEAGTLPMRPQPGQGITYAAKISKSEARIDWNGPAAELDALVRGLAPFPGAWCEIELGNKRERLKLLRSQMADGKGKPGEVLDASGIVACGTGALQLLEVQKAGGKAMTARDFFAGHRVNAGTQLV